MRAIVLAAGMGNRLRGVFNDPKCLISIGGVCLLERYLECFCAVGIKEVVLVLGYRMGKVIEYVENLPQVPRIHIVKNMNYDKGDILSLWAARDWLWDNILLMDGDMYFEKDFLVKAAKSEQDNFFLIDSKPVNDGEAAMVGFKKGKAVSVSKELRGEFDLIGEWAGVLKLSPTGSSALKKIVCEEVEQGKIDEGYGFFEPRLFDSINISYELVDQLNWVEIDFPNDIKKAEKIARMTEGTD